MNTPENNLKLAERGALLSIGVYLLLTVFKLTLGNLLGSSSLTADGFNNLSDILGNVAVLIGLRLAQKPADRDHKFGHWKIEDLASLLTSIIMFLVGFQVLMTTVDKLVNQQQEAIDPLGAFVGVISAFIMYLVYRHNKALAERVKSGSLMAAAKDNLSDALTSIGTSIAILASSLNFPILDQLTAIVITFFILKTAYEIFKESSFSLSDGFDEELLNDYEKVILEHPKVISVISQRGRTYGSNIYLDLVLEMNPDLSVYESHAITEDIEDVLMSKFGVFDIDIHVEPSSIPEDEEESHLSPKLFKFEKTFLAQIPDYEDLIDENCQFITSKGQLSKDEFLKFKDNYFGDIEDYNYTSISRKTKELTYQIGNLHHTSLWRRHEEWHLIFHQITELKKD